ncbi:Charged multivesicular body protein 5 [Frankliniella fusca]|uniref:Charged multivesicular body protein 5 n=1 Tax=Frankliniella fusca TaxID=407009 RepID=A0AAE1H0F4_9NEOP|nr:Charged multivesicular body protein 5 [Frankliniella fusca]
MRLTASAGPLLALVLVLALACERTAATCVFNSEFGFTIDCAFKKSGLFRVRNLGGVKGFASLGFSVGDELGFKESLSNVENNRRRSVSRTSALLAKQQDEAAGVTRLLPAQPNAVARQALDVLKQSRLQEQQQEQQEQQVQRAAQARYLQQAVPPFRPIPGADGGAPLVGVAVMASPQGYAAAPSANLGYSNLAAASRWNTTRPLRLAAVPLGALPQAQQAQQAQQVQQVPPFQQLPSSISRVASVAPAGSSAQVSRDMRDI